jgi:hypothetical protein
MHDLPVPVPWKAWLLLLKTRYVGPFFVFRLQWSDHVYRRCWSLSSGLIAFVLDTARMQGRACTRVSHQLIWSLRRSHSLYAAPARAVMWLRHRYLRQPPQCHYDSLMIK